MRSISEATSRITKKNFTRKYIALGRIVERWSDVVGKELAQKAQPVKLRYRKRNRSKKPEVILDIAISNAEATLLHYQKDLILERINQIFGDQWITGLRFVTSPANTEIKINRKITKALTAKEKNHLSSMLDRVADAGIKERLESLGQSIISESKP